MSPDRAPDVRAVTQPFLPRVAVLLAGVLVLAACAGAVPELTADDASWATLRWPDASPATLADGRRLYLRRCAGCHQLYPPADFAPEAWPAVLARMAAPAHLRPDEAAKIERYLVTAARPARGGRRP